MKLPEQVITVMREDLVKIIDPLDPCCGLRAVVVELFADEMKVILMDGTGDDDDDDLVPYERKQLQRLFVIKLEFPKLMVDRNGKKAMIVTDESGALRISTRDFGMEALEGMIPLFRDTAPKDPLGWPKPYHLLAWAQADGNLGFEPKPLEDQGW